jgi:hypothetical protein
MKEENSTTQKKRGVFVKDQQTGNVYELHRESTLDTEAAIASIVYLLAMLYFIIRLFIDVCSGEMKLMSWFSTKVDLTCLSSATCCAITYAAIGGALGGIVNGFRSILNWHTDRESFSWRHIWRYIILPFLGASLAVIVYAVVRSGLAAVGVDLEPAKGAENCVPAKQVFVLIALGALCGYGSHQVFRWLDLQVAKIFKTAGTEVIVPDLDNLPIEDAIKAIQAAKLKVGNIDYGDGGASLKSYRVKGQKPEKGQTVQESTSVDITLKQTT